MASTSAPPIARSKRAFHSSSKASDLEIQHLKTEAQRCRTPQQFLKLLERVRSFIPYQKFAGVWGYPSRTTIRFVFNHGFPVDFIRWHLTTGTLWTSPAFQEWLRTKRVLIWCQAAKRQKGQFDPELLKRVKQAGLQNSLYGGLASRYRFVLFIAAMPSARSCRAYLTTFETVLPWLVQASQRAYPRTLLTKRETAILERRAMGEITKQIGKAEGISERTVREHLQQIKKKLYTDDLVNAVVIAVKSGMLLAPKGGYSRIEAAARARAKD